MKHRRRGVQHVTHYPYYGYGYPYHDPYYNRLYREPKFIVAGDKQGFEPHFAIDGKRLKISLHWPTIVATLFVSYMIWGKR